MAKRLRKTLPKNLEELLTQSVESGDDTAVLQALEACLPDARGGYAKGTVLGLRTCTRTVAEWAIARGTDINASDTYGRAPLHHAAQRRRSPLSVEDVLDLGATLELPCKAGRTAMHYAADAQNLPAVQALLARGLDADGGPDASSTPLEYALQRMSNVNFPQMVPVARALLAAGAQKSDLTREYAEKAAERFEFHRAGFNPEFVDETAAAMVALCELMDAEVPGQRRTHDGRSPITTSSERWQDQHQELWELLVPSRGACKTVQGEVIRISGRISDELFRNGGGNWDRDYRTMTNALLEHLGSGQSLSGEQLAEAQQVASALLHEMNGANRLAELAVAWVGLNPDPVSLQPPSYHR
ncbi:MAG: ankyrin repeat domain-containing protein [Proteobacteria bacterium]|nr:ankyrin repeat domain-containing protein [Pseudomonadota bacterium]